MFVVINVCFLKAKIDIITAIHKKIIVKYL